MKAGKVNATGTEDMDALAFGSSILLRHLTFGGERKKPIKEFCLDQVLKQLDLTQDEVRVLVGVGRWLGVRLWVSLHVTPAAELFNMAAEMYVVAINCNVSPV